MERVCMEGIPRGMRLRAATRKGTYGEKKHYLEKLVRDEIVLPEQEEYGERLEHMVLIGDAEYPRGLYRLPDPPFALYVKGNRSLLHRSGMALVGARSCSTYSRQVTEYFTEHAVAAGILAISGGALGVDAAVHRTALSKGGRTVAVLGGGLDVPYPSAHRKLFQQIGEEGLLVSEYPAGFSPQKWTFPMRNRIIAALSEGVLVVEASDRSGALHTATHGISCGIGVQAVPGSIFGERFRGNHELLSMGAEVVFDARRWVEDFVLSHPQVILHRLQDLALWEVWMERAQLAQIFQLSLEVLEKSFRQLEPHLKVERDGECRYAFRTNF